MSVKPQNMVLVSPMVSTHTLTHNNNIIGNQIDNKNKQDRYFEGILINRLTTTLPVDSFTPIILRMRHHISTDILYCDNNNIL